MNAKEKRNDAEATQRKRKGIDFIEPEAAKQKV
jgi:hypothetical protein